MRLGRSLSGRAQRLTIYLSRTEHHGRNPDYVEIVARARELGMAGATVLPGAEGFGRGTTVHGHHAVSLTEELPVVVRVIDTPERIDGFLVDVAGLASKATFVRQGVDVVLHGGQVSRA